MDSDNEMSKDEAKQMQPLVLAIIGDAVQTLFVREYVAKAYGFKVNKMNKVVASVVNAGSQFKTMKKLESELSDEESEIVHRARNTHIHTKAKNFSYAEYVHATALEALIGFHYLTKDEIRLREILEISLEEINLDI